MQTAAEWRSAGEAAILKDDEDWLVYINGIFGLQAESLDVAVGLYVCVRECMCA